MSKRVMKESVRSSEWAIRLRAVLNVQQAVLWYLREHRDAGADLDDVIAELEMALEGWD